MTVRLAVVGSGFMAGTHLDAFRSVDDAELVAIVSRSRERGEALASKHGARWTDDLDSVLSSYEVDAVDICVPTDLHVEMAVAALDAGKGVLLEKPIALDVDGADRILAAEARSEAILMVGLVLRFWPEYARFLSMIDAGELGDIEVFTAYRLSPPAAWNDWMRDEVRSGGVPVDLMTHDFDQVIAVMGMPEGVNAVSTVDRQHVFAQLVYDDRTASVEGSMSMPDSFPFSCGFRAGGGAGMVSYDFQVGAAVEGGNLGEAATRGGLVFAPSGRDRSLIEVEPDDPFVAEVAYFVECVASGTPPTRATSRQARDSLVVARAVNRALSSRAATALEV